MNMLIVALRYLQQRKTRTFLTTLAILFGVAVVYGTNAMFPAMNAAIEQTTLSPDNPRVTIVPGYSYTSTNFDAVSDLAGLQAVRGVVSTAGRLSQRLMISLPEQERTSLIDVVGIDAAQESAEDFPLLTGRLLQAGERNALVVSYFFAEVTGLGVGDSFDLLGNGELYEIVGVLDASRRSTDVFIPLAELQAAYGMEGQLNSIIVTVDPQVPVRDIAEGLNLVFGEYDYNFEGGINLNNAALSNNALVVIFNIFGALALFVGAFLIYITFTTAVIERRRDLAMLRAIGADRAQISRLMTLEALLQGVFGAVAGIIVGQVFALMMLRLIWSVSYQSFEAPAAVPVHLPSMLLAVVVGLVTALSAGYLPARAAGRLSPLEALRPASEVEVRRVARLRIALGVAAWVVSLVLLLGQDRLSGIASFTLLVGAVLIVPVLITPLIRLSLPLVDYLLPNVSDLIRTSIMRQPWRTAATVNLMAIGFAIFVAVMSLFSPIMASTTAMMNSQSPDADVSLFNLNRQKPLDFSVVDRLNALPNIADTTVVTEAQAQINGRDVAVLGVDPSYGTRMRPYSIMLDSAQMAAVISQEEADPIVRELANGQSALISSSLSMEAGLEMGDIFTLNRAQGERVYQVSGIGFIISSSQNPNAVIIAANPQDFPDAVVSEVISRFVDDSQSDATIAQIVNTVLVDYPEVYLQDANAVRSQRIGDAQRGLSIFYVLAALVLVPSVLGLLNTLVMNVLERTREIGMLRATGASQLQVRRAVIGEGLLIGFISAIIGTIVGIGVGYGLLTTMSNLGENPTPYTFSIPVLGFVLALGAGLLLIWLATQVPARRAARLDILEALRYE